MNEISAQDLLDADEARVESRRKPLLTKEGRRVLREIVSFSKPLPQEEIDKIIRFTMKQHEHKKAKVA